MINKLWVLNGDYVSSEKDGKLDFIRLGKISFLIGANNSGKSRFMRKLFQESVDNFYLSSESWGREVYDLFKPLLEVVPSTHSGKMIFGKLLHELINGKYDLFKKHKEYCKELEKFIDNLYAYSSIGGEENSIFQKARRVAVRKHENGFSSPYKVACKELPDKIYLPKRFYVPILRGMRPLDGDKDLLCERTLMDYFGGSDVKKEDIITGFNIYDLLARNLLGKPSERERIRLYEKKLGDWFFSGQEVTLIPEYGKDTVAMKIGDDDQFSICDLGDGLQQSIIISSAAYLNSDPSLFFIEEPEISLHPGLLRRLVEFLLCETAHQYVIATHSNHLLEFGELREDIVVHRFAKNFADKGSKFVIRECSKDRDLLAELGVHASSVYLSNSTIWVEGVTDRLYLAEFLKKYIACLSEGHEKRMINGFLENYHYVFIEYQGGNIGHWCFDESMADRLQAMSLCSEAFVVADGDIRNKGTRVEDLKSQLGDRLFILPGKEIENLLPHEVVRVTALKIFDSKRDRNEYDKDKLSGINYSKYSRSDQGLGSYLDGLLGLKGRGKDAKRFFADASGTVADKVKFCRTAVQVMSEIEWKPTPEINELCATIFAHIKKNNPMASVLK